MTRAHLFRPLQDGAGNLQRGASVRLYRPGTTELVNSNLFIDETSDQTYSQPIVCPTGFLNVYLDRPRRFRVGVTPFGGGTEVFFDDIDTALSIDPASNVPIDPIEGLLALDVQAALQEIQGTKYGPGAEIPTPTASEVAFTPYGLYLDDTLDVQSALQDVDDALAALGTRTDDVETVNGVQTGRLDGHETRLDEAEIELADHETRIDALETTDTGYDTRLDALEATDVGYDTRLDGLEAADVALDSRVDALESAPPPVGNTFASTTGPGLPTATTRDPGDLHFDTTALQEYVVTGMPPFSTGGSKTYTMDLGTPYSGLPVVVTLTLSNYRVEGGNAKFDFEWTATNGVNYTANGGSRLRLYFRAANGVVDSGITTLGSGDATSGTHQIDIASRPAPYMVFWQYQAGGGPLSADDTTPGQAYPESRAWTSTDSYVAPHTHTQVQAFTTKTANYTLTATDGIVFFTGASLTATLPTPVGRVGQQYVIKNLDASNLTVATAAGLIDGTATRTLAQYDTLTVVSDGTNWGVL